MLPSVTSYSGHSAFKIYFSWFIFVSLHHQTKWEIRNFFVFSCLAVEIWQEMQLGQVSFFQTATLEKKGNKFFLYFTFIGGCNETNLRSLIWKFVRKNFRKWKRYTYLSLIILFDLVFYQNHKDIKVDVHYHDFLNIRHYSHIPVPFSGIWNLKMSLHIKKHLIMIKLFA